MSGRLGRRHTTADGRRARPSSPFVGRLRTSSRIPLLALASLHACDLDDTVIPPSQAGIVVHGVMRPDQPQQFVLVEQTFDGSVSPVKNVQAVPPGGLQTAVSGALVAVANLDFPTDPCGASVSFNHGPLTGAPVTGVYFSPPGCPTMRPGDRLELRVDVPSLGSVVGITRVPALDAATMAVGGGQVRQPGDSVPLNRDREVLDIVTAARYHRALQILSYRVGTIPPGMGPAFEDPPLALMLFVDSAAATLPGTVRHVFARGSGSDAFHGGRRYRVVVGLADTNYYDFVRTENNEITGRGFANHLRGGIGVFGSLAAAAFFVEAVAEVDDPREGTYDFAGTIEEATFSGSLSLYLAPGPGSVLGPGQYDSDVSGFMQGTWLSWVRGPGGEKVAVPRDVSGQSVDGRFQSGRMYLTIPTYEQRDGPDAVVELALQGTYRNDRGFGVEVAQATVVSRTVLGTVTFTKR
jgi:hypothetical protein